MPCCKADVCPFCEEEAGNTKCPFCDTLIVRWMISPAHYSVEHTERKERELNFRREMRLGYDTPLNV